MKDEGRLVYSTDGSLPLPAAGPTARRAHVRTGPALPDDGTVRVGCERRRGGSVTTIHGLAAGELAQVASELRRRCGTGGTAKGGIVELQGDHRDAVIAHLSAQGRRTKRSGG